MIKKNKRKPKYPKGLKPVKISKKAKSNVIKNVQDVFV